jgi:hypothetical protein
MPESTPAMLARKQRRVEVDRRLREMIYADRVAHLKAAGWRRAIADDDRSWYHPDGHWFPWTLSRAIREQVEREFDARS